MHESMMIVAGDGIHEYGPLRQPDELGDPFCVQQATDVLLERLPTSEDAAAIDGLQEATEVLIKLRDRALGKVVCHVTGCQVRCTAFGTRRPDGVILLSKVVSADDGTSMCKCIRGRPREDGPASE